jgi:mono/diheme cytochrome c family protein
MRRIRQYIGSLYGVAGLLGMTLLLLACSGSPTQEPAATGERPTLQPSAAEPTSPPNTGEYATVVVTAPELSPSARSGQTLFNANCAVCHGANASGSNAGPPLVHPYYGPGHHPDFAFKNAVQNGVPSHHWWFGDMAPLPGVSEQDVDQIICYVRELQRANGIFEGDAC